MTSSADKIDVSRANVEYVCRVLARQGEHDAATMLRALLDRAEKAEQGRERDKQIISDQAARILELQRDMEHFDQAVDDNARLRRAFTALVAKWHKRYKDLMDEDRVGAFEVDGLQNCADELESALTAHSAAQSEKQTVADTTGEVK